MKFKMSIEVKFLNDLVNSKKEVCMFTKTGLSLRGVIKDFSEVCILLSYKGEVSLIYKKFIASISKACEPS